MQRKLSRSAVLGPEVVPHPGAVEQYAKPGQDWCRVLLWDEDTADGFTHLTIPLALHSPRSALEEQRAALTLKHDLSECPPVDYPPLFINDMGDYSNFPRACARMASAVSLAKGECH